MNNFKHRLQYLWYKYIYGVEIGYTSSLPAAFGKGKYVDVLKRGPYIDIINHSNSMTPNGMIRIIPAQYNHGFFIEFHDLNHKLRWRNVISYDQLYKMGVGLGEQPR